MRRAMNRVGKAFGSMSALALSLALCLAPTAADAKVRRVKAQKIQNIPGVTGPGFNSFTPAAADPKLAAAFARSGLGTGTFKEGAFRFTPSGGTNRRAITVAVRARAVTKQEAAKTLAVSTDMAPSAYSLGLSVGWKRFALSGDVSKLDAGGILRDTHESADIGLSYSGRRWQTKLDLSADRNNENALVGIDQSWSVGLGGTYALTHNLDLSGGIRYKAQRDQFQSILSDTRRDGQAVYLGTTFRF